MRATLIGRPQRTLVSIALVLGSIVDATPGVAALQTPAERPVFLDHGGELFTGVVRMPESPARPPVVLLVTDADAGALSAALAAERVASLRLDARSADPAALAQWVSFLRNDEHFPLVTVFADGAAMEPAVVAARAARADGVATRGDRAAAASEIGRVVAAVKSIDGRSDADIAKQLAAFARSVPALGRRGTSPNRTVARRSLRHTVMASVGDVRISIEWGQPTMRGRTIWGELVEWERIWMPGADEATVLATNGPIAIGGVRVPAGDHTLYTMPGPDRFELLISRDVGQFHTVHDLSLVMGRTDMTLQTKSDPTEGLTFAIRPGADDRSATLTLAWDRREYAVALTSARQQLSDSGHHLRPEQFDAGQEAVMRERARAVFHVETRQAQIADRLRNLPGDGVRRPDA